MEKENDNSSNLKVWVIVMKFVDSSKEGAEGSFTENVTTYKSDGCHSTRCVIVIGKDVEMQCKMSSSLILHESTRQRVLSFWNAELKRKGPNLSPQAPAEAMLNQVLLEKSIVELHLDGIFKRLEPTVLPLELFKCTSVEVLSLKNNNLVYLPADIGRLSRLKSLALTNNCLRNHSIPFTLTFCKCLKYLYLDHNLLDALPGFLLQMPQLTTVHRHGNHNYFKSTFMWYHTDLNDRVLQVGGGQCKKRKDGQLKFQPETLEMLTVQAVIASKQNFFEPGYLPVVLQDYIAAVYRQYDVCGYCNTAKHHSQGGFKVYTFKNPYLGNTCVPFQHYACSYKCAKAIEVPAHAEQRRAAQKMDRQYQEYIKAIQSQQKEMRTKKSSCCIL